MNYYLDVLKKYAEFNGRARRKEYWMFFLINILISFSLNFGLAMISPSLALLGTFYSLAVFVPSIAVAIRRMHDVGKSGWYCLIPIYNLILACTEGDQGPNEYGQDPKSDLNEIDEIGTIQS